MGFWRWFLLAVALVILVVYLVHNAGESTKPHKRSYCPSVVLDCQEYTKWDAVFPATADN